MVLATDVARGNHEFRNTPPDVSRRLGYGVAASPLIVLLWVYYSAQLLFWGAEFTKVYTHASGSRCDRQV